MPKIRILAIDPTWYGFGFAVMEGHRVLLDFGTTWVKAGHATNKIDYLLQSYAPTVIVLEERMRKGSRHRVKANHLIWQILRSAVTHKIRVKWISRSDLKRAFAPARNRYERACAIARLYPELGSYLPPKRKIWTGEAHRMNIFDAVALTLTDVSER